MGHYVKGNLTGTKKYYVKNELDRISMFDLIQNYDLSGNDIRIKFLNNDIVELLFFDIIELKGLKGTITYSDYNQINIKLDKRFKSLNEWNNEIILNLFDETNAKDFKVFVYKENLYQ